MNWLILYELKVLRKLGVCLCVFVQAVQQNTIEVMESMIDQREHKLEDLKESAAKSQVRTVQNVQICITIITIFSQGSLTF